MGRSITTVRDAGHMDIEDIIPELGKLDECHPVKRDIFENGENAANFLRDLIDYHILILSEKDGILTGFLGAMTAEHFMNKKFFVASEVLFWVKEEYRQTRAAYMLLKEYKELAVNWGVDWIEMSTVCGASNINDRSMKKQGFSIGEKRYFLELDRKKKVR